MGSRIGLIITSVDSSALLRLCLAEGDLTLIERALRNLPTASLLASIEVPCAISARWHRGLITPDARDRLLTTAQELLEATTLVAVTPAIQREAIAVAARFLVRTLDAIHLGTAVVIAHQQRRRGNTLRFCTADFRQADAAVALLGTDNVDCLPPLA